MEKKVKEYLFRTIRLGFRNWVDSDLEPLSAINADPDVMNYFSAIQSREETRGFIKRMQQRFTEKGYCYFAVDTLREGGLIGFIGLSDLSAPEELLPAVDIGWRLNKKYWNQGYATEGAMACLDYAFRQLQLKKVYSITPVANVPSEAVMKKIGMKKQGTFIHPKLVGDARLEKCLLYCIEIAEQLAP